MRVLYPDLVFGAIASSAVTHAALVYWEYFDLIRNYTEPHCRGAIEHTVATVDRLLGSRVTRNWVKHLFGLGKLDSDQDFVSVLHVCHSIHITNVLLTTRRSSTHLGAGKRKTGIQK